jgi:hypothetical protein
LLAGPTQLTDAKVPTPRQTAGERYGEQKARHEARTRRNTRDWYLAL